MHPTPPPDVLTTLGAVAIELSASAAVGRTRLSQTEAGDWAAGIAADLARLVPEVAELDLIVVAALFDPAELLRPNFPCHAVLERYAAQVPGNTGGRVIAFGAGPDGLAADLSPQVDLIGGPMRVLPFLLRGPAEAVAQVAAAFEEHLLDTGMANAGTALATQAAFGLHIEHMRYLTLHDLMALTAMQYEHAGLGCLWPMIEAALFGDGNEVLLDAPPEPLLRYANGAVRIALLDAEAWAQGGFVPPGIDLARSDAERLWVLFDHFEARQRQFAAVFGAHGIEITFDHCPANKDPRAILRAD